MLFIYLFMIQMYTFLYTKWNTNIPSKRYNLSIINVNEEIYILSIYIHIYYIHTHKIYLSVRLGLRAAEVVDISLIS